jgi:hypothetical protein
MDKNLAIIEPEIINPRESKTIEEALGISEKRFMQLGFIMDDIWSSNKTRGEALFSLSNDSRLTFTEKTYMGYKLSERIHSITGKRKSITGSISRLLGGGK